MLRINKSIVISLVLMIVAASLLFGQAKETGAIQGTISDSEGAPVPGVTVTGTNMTLKGRDATAYTDEKGRYRFPAMAPGTYEIKAVLEGFQTATRKDVRLFVGNTIEVDLSVGQTVAETIEISGETPLIDATSSASSKTVAVETLETLPKMSFALDIFTLTPGVSDTSYVAYGAGGPQANAYWFDGVDLSNPVTGSYWVYPNYNWIEEVQVVGIGAPAEYGQFTGVVTNSVSRSGSNQFHGLFETFFQNDSLTYNNIDLPEIPDDVQPDRTDLFTDSTVQLSGPLVQDKLWFFASGQYYYNRYAPFGYPADGSSALVKDEQPRVLGKLTYKANENNTMQGFLEWDNYLVDGDAADATFLQEATALTEAPQWFYNASWISILNSETVLDVRYSGYNAKYDNLPRNGETPSHGDFGTGIYSQNYYYIYTTDRTRNQVNASVSHYASDFIKGSHDFKFGVEYEHSSADRSQTYPGGIYYLDYYGAPYYRYIWEGYDTQGRIRRTSAYAQDSWHVGDKLNINVGARFDHSRVFLADAPIEITTNAVAPRLGFTYDLKGNQSTILKAHYGRYYQKPVTLYIDGIDDFGDKSTQYWNGSEWEEVDFDPGVSVWTVDNNIKQPYTNQFTVGADQAFSNGFTLSAHYIYRKDEDLIEDIETGGVFGDVPFVNPFTGETITVFNQENPDDPATLLITNADILFREYHGVEIYGSKRFGNKFSLTASLVLSKSEGNVGNTQGGANGFSTILDDPNYNINFEGRMDYDSPVEVKIYGHYDFPFDILASFYYRHFSGYTFTPTVRIPSSVVDQGPITIFAVPRGSERLDARNVLDFRAEKGFAISSNGELKFTFDFFNILNTGYVYDLDVRVDRGSFLNPTEFTSPREIRLGIRYQF